MYAYGEQWHLALTKILKRLAHDEGPGLLILIGPDGSGKSDLIGLLISITENAQIARQLRAETGGLAELAHARGYLAVPVVKDTLYLPTVPVSALGHLLGAVCSNGLRPGRRILLVWDDIDQQLEDWDKAANYAFLEVMHRPLELYRHMTFVMSMTTKGRQEEPEIPGFTGGPGHFLHL